MTDFRALCEELLAAIQLYTKLNPAASEMSAFELTEKLMDAMAATAAALAEQPVGPTDEELRELFDEKLGPIGFAEDWPWIRNFARAVLARWGQS